MQAVQHINTAHTRQPLPVHAMPDSGDEAFERWLREEVVPAYDALKADPSQALTAAQVRAHLAQVAAEHAKTV